MDKKKPGARLIDLQLLLLAAVCLLPMAGEAAPSPQEKSPQENADNRPVKGDAPAACVLGRIITEKEVRLLAAQIGKMNPDMPKAIVAWRARRELARQVLLLETAKRYGSEIHDDEVTLHYTEDLGLDPALVEKEFDAFRDEFMIHIYIRARMGLDGRMKDVVPDMAAYFRVTPEEMRSCYRNYPELSTQQKKVVLVRCRLPWGAKGRAAAEECRQLLLAEPKAVKPEELAEKFEGCRCDETTYKGKEVDDLGPLILDFVRKGKKGSVSNLIETELPQPVLNLFLIKEKQDERTLPFNEVREKLMDLLQDNKIQRIRLMIMEDLVDKEWRSCWPADLFQLHPKMAPAESSDKSAPAPEK